MWGYNKNDTQGEELADWSEAKGLRLVFDAKQRGTFQSAR